MKLAVLGATGAVGRTMLQILEERARSGPFADFTDAKKRLSIPPRDLDALSAAGAFDFAGKVPIDRIRTDGGTQPRASIDFAVALDYAEDLNNGATFPPLRDDH